MKHCLLCGGTNFKKIIYFKKEQISLLKCRSCGLVFLNPIKILKSVISDDYIDLDIENSYYYFKNTRIYQYKKDMGIIRKYIPSGKLIDVGSSFGLFLNYAYKYFEVIGIEPSKTTCSFSHKKFPKLNIINTVFEKNKFRKNQFDVLTLWSVLEHTVNPRKIILKAKSILKDNGLIAIRVPNYSGLIPKLILLIHKITFGKINGFSRSLYQMDFTYKHFYHFNKNTLTKLLEKNDFEIVYFYKENSLNKKFLKDRTSISSSKEGVNFLKNPFIVLCIKIILTFCDMLDVQDEIVIFAKKNSLNKGK